MGGQCGAVGGGSHRGGAAMSEEIDKIDKHVVRKYEVSHKLWTISRTFWTFPEVSKRSGAFSHVFVYFRALGKVLRQHFCQATLGKHA